MYIKRILLIIALIGLVAMGIFSYYIYNTLLVPNTGFNNEKAYVYVKSDATYQDVHDEIKPLLKDVDKFDVVAKQKKYVNNVKPGRYAIFKDMNNLEIINVLRSKNEPLGITFNNQNRLPDLAQRISKQIEADSVSLMAAMTDSTFLAKNGFTPLNALEMYIPNKYEFYWNTSASKFRDRMLKEYKRFWNDKRLAKADSIGFTPNEVQIIASIVQKETAQVKERRRVAGVYINRLKRGMKLEADPTVIYAIKHKNQAYDTIIKRVLYADLKTDSPYNTYLRAGLPPGPISMPDISSIDAVLNYEKHNFLYFVADPKNPGYHKFSKSLRQHNIYKQAYIQWLKKLNIRR